MALWFAIPKLALQSLRQIEDLSFHLASLIFLLEGTKSFSMKCELTLTQIFILHKYVCEEKKAECFEGIYAVPRIIICQDSLKYLGFMSANT